MAQMPRTPPRPRHLVWRISADAPQGEWVDPRQSKPPAAPQPKLAEPEVSAGSWVTSSFDLLSGTDVIEGSDTLSPKAFNELFDLPQPDVPKGPAT